VERRFTRPDSCPTSCQAADGSRDGTRTGVNALPGFATVENQTEFYETIVANHWGLFANLVDTLILPAVGFWVVAFGAIQLAVGAALLVGYRTRLFGLIGLGYLGLLIGMGFTRLARSCSGCWWWSSPSTVVGS
jgi:hypothetical protein